MKRAVRNRLAELLLDSFEEPEKRQAVLLLALFCKLAARRDRPEVPLITLLRKRPPAFHRRRESVESALASLTGPVNLLRLRNPETGEVPTGPLPRLGERMPWLVEPNPDVRPAFALVCERARIYAGLASQMRQGDTISRRRDPLCKAMVGAALCFNVGLYFEAHELLEQRWATQPTGPLRQFLQGIIQISVGFHHAHSGNYIGAVNQLGKGLEKTIGTTGEVLGLDCDAFLPEVKAVREAIMKRRRSGMRPLPLTDIPRMAVHG